MTGGDAVSRVAGWQLAVCDGFVVKIYDRLLWVCDY